MRRYSFATVVSRTEGHLFASHLPLLLDSAQGPHGTLVGHMARANPQWHGFADGEEVLAIFQGPHAYISPSWYDIQPSVPTCNYAAVHAYGRAHLIEDKTELHDLLRTMAKVYEAGLARPWSIENLPEDFTRKLLRAIVGFAIPVERIEAKFKLGQNRSEADRNGVVEALKHVGGNDAAELAELTGRFGISSATC